MGFAFHQLCPRYSGTLTPTAPMAIRLWDTFTFTLRLSYHWDMNLSGFWLPFFWIFIGSRCIDQLLPDALVSLVSRDTGVEVGRGGTGWQGGSACACGLTRKRLLPDICSCCVPRMLSVSCPSPFFFQTCGI